MRIFRIISFFCFISTTLVAQSTRQGVSLSAWEDPGVHLFNSSSNLSSTSTYPFNNQPLRYANSTNPNNRKGLLYPADTLHKTRFWTSAAIGAATYTGVMIGLNEIWYAEFERSNFQFFNDWGEWKDLDKMGHTFTAYMESIWVYKSARWAGLEERKSIWLGVALGSLFQASVETLDGFSAEWGFSVPDMAFNTLGVTTFAAQQLSWGEQRIALKVSAYHRPYPDHVVYPINDGEAMVLSDRARELFGSTWAEQFIKDYNAQTIWASFNIRSFLHRRDSKIPPWLNVAVGYGAENMFGGFGNNWTMGNSNYQLDDDLFPRYRQFYLSLDVDLTRIKTKSPLLKMLFSMINVIKIPAPALEVNTLGNFRFHPFHF